jgi:hypothetical protein
LLHVVADLAVSGEILPVADTCVGFRIAALLGMCCVAPDRGMPSFPPFVVRLRSSALCRPQCGSQPDPRRRVAAFSPPVIFRRVVARPIIWRTVIMSLFVMDSCEIVMIEY